MWLYLHPPRIALDESILDQQCSYTEKTTIVHTTLRVSDVTDKWKNWLADVTFKWRHVMETAVERNDQARWFITFFRRLFYKIYIKTSRIMNKTM